jgi:hypothetical protein
MLMLMPCPLHHNAISIYTLVPLHPGVENHNANVNARVERNEKEDEKKGNEKEKKV